MKLLGTILRPFSLFILFLVTCASCQQGQNSDTTYDLLIRHATVVDGTGAEAFTANVFVNADTIALIEKDTAAAHKATKTIDATGLVLTPGFIDTHAHGNPMQTPDFKNFLAMGITTITLGQDGFSPNQKDLSTWMDSVDTVKPAVNVALFAGHGTLRMLSGIGYDSIPTGQKLEGMEQLLAQAMDAGCYGLSTGLEYMPGYYASGEELNRLAKVVGQKNGLVMSHMRNEDDAFVEASIKELLAQGRYCPVHVSHMKVVFGKGAARAREILQLLDSARASGTQVTADIYPYTASYTGIGILFPDWALKPNDYKKVLATKRKDLATYLRDRVNLRNGPEATLIGSGPYKGKTLAQVATERNKPFEDVLMDDIGPYGASGAYFVMNEELQETLLTDPHVMICTDGSPTMNHPRGFGTFAKVIQHYVVAKKLLPLEKAIWKMTGLSSKTLGIEKRGTIQVGHKADLLLFNPANVKETATFENPYQLATGFDYVLVNGHIAKENTDFMEARYGKMLRKTSR